MHAIVVSVLSEPCYESGQVCNDAGNVIITSAGFNGCVERALGDGVENRVYDGLCGDFGVVMHGGGVDKAGDDVVCNERGQQRRMKSAALLKT